MHPLFCKIAHSHTWNQRRPTHICGTSADPLTYVEPAQTHSLMWNQWQTHSHMWNVRQTHSHMWNQRHTHSRTWNLPLKPPLSWTWLLQRRTAFCQLSPSTPSMFFIHSLPSCAITLACINDLISPSCLQRTIKIIFPRSFTDPLGNHIVYFLSVLNL